MSYARKIEMSRQLLTRALRENCDRLLTRLVFSVNGDVMRLFNRIKMALVEGTAFGAVFPELLKERTASFLGQGNAGLVTASKSPVVLLLKPAGADARVNSLDYCNSHDLHGVVWSEDCQQIRLDIAGHGEPQCTGSVRQHLWIVGRQTRLVNKRKECQVDDVADGVPIVGTGLLRGLQCFSRARERHNDLDRWSRYQRPPCCEDEQHDEFRLGHP